MPKDFTPVALDSIDSTRQFTKSELAQSDSLQELREKCARYAQAKLPEAIRKAVYIMENGKNEKTILDAIKFIKDVAEQTQGQEKTVTSLKAVKDRDIEEILRKAGNDDHGD